MGDGKFFPFYDIGRKIFFVFYDIGRKILFVFYDIGRKIFRPYERTVTSIREEDGISEGDSGISEGDSGISEGDSGISEEAGVDSKVVDPIVGTMFVEDTNAYR